MMTTATFRYRPTRRPARYGSMPVGLTWEFVERGTADPLPGRTDLPMGTTKFGIVGTYRPLTDAEKADFELEPC